MASIFHQRTLLVSHERLWLSDGTNCRVHSRSYRVNSRSHRVHIGSYRFINGPVSSSSTLQSYGDISWRRRLRRCIWLWGCGPVGRWWGCRWMAVGTGSRMPHCRWSWYRPADEGGGKRTIVYSEAQDSGTFANLDIPLNWLMMVGHFMSCCN